MTAILIVSLGYGIDRRDDPTINRPVISHKDRLALLDRAPMRPNLRHDDRATISGGADTECT